CLSPTQPRDAAIREERTRAALMRARGHRAGRRALGAEPQVHPAEILAAMDLPLPSDPQKKITEKTVMEAVAEAANLPFVVLDPLKIDAKLAPQYLSRP